MEWNGYDQSRGGGNADDTDVGRTSLQLEALLLVEVLRCTGEPNPLLVGLLGVLGFECTHRKLLVTGVLVSEQVLG